VLAISTKLLKVALVSTGVAAFIVVLGSIAAYFMRSGEGAAKLAKILAQLKSVFDTLIKGVVQYGKGLADIFSFDFKKGYKEMATAFYGMGEQIKENWKSSGALADAEKELEKREIALITTLSERKAKASELREMAKEEVEDQHKKVALINEAADLYKSAYGDEIALETARISIMKQKLAEKSSDPTLEQQRAIAEQQAKINDLYRDQADQLKGLNRERAKALAFVTNELALEKAKTDQASKTVTEIGNIKMPPIGPAIDKAIGTLAGIPKTLEGLDLTKAINKALGPLRNLKEPFDKFREDLAKGIQSSLDSAAESLGEFFGALMIGQAGIKDFSNMMLGAFAELAITIGKLAIASAITVGALDQILKNPEAWPIALAAGIALVAVGSAIRGSLAKAADKGGVTASVSGSGSGSSGGVIYDTRTINPKPIEVKVTGTLEGSGSTLRAVLKQEENRLAITS
jgi:hypothetical protein